MEDESVYERTPQNGTPEEVRRYLKISPRTLANYQRRGLLRPIYFGKYRRFRWAEVIKLEKNGVR